MRRQKNTQNSDSWKQCDREESSNSTRTRKLVRAVTPRTEFQKNEVHKPSIHEEGLPFFLQKKLGITARYSTFALEASKVIVLIWRMFMSSSMEAAIHLGPNYLANVEVHKNTNFEEFRVCSISHRN